MAGNVTTYQVIYYLKAYLYSPTIAGSAKARCGPPAKAGAHAWRWCGELYSAEITLGKATVDRETNLFCWVRGTGLTCLRCLLLVLGRISIYPMYSLQLQLFAE